MVMKEEQFSWFISFFDMKSATTHINKFAGSGAMPNQ